MQKYWISCGLIACLLMSSQAITPGRIDKINATATGVELTIETTAGDSYQVQCRTSLTSGEWVDQGLPFVADSSTSVWSVATTESNCFMRVVATNQYLTYISDPGAPPPPPPPPPMG